MKDSVSSFFETHGVQKLLSQSRIAASMDRDSVIKAVIMRVVECGGDVGVREEKVNIAADWAASVVMDIVLLHLVLSGEAHISVPKNEVAFMINKKGGE